MLVKTLVNKAIKEFENTYFDADLIKVATENTYQNWLDRKIDVKEFMVDVENCIEDIVEGLK